MFRKLTDILKEENKKKSERADKVKKLLDSGNFILFFTKGSDIYGAPEDSRIVFSKMKAPDYDDMNWDQAKFSALNLIRALVGDTQQSVFSSQDLPQIQVIDRDNAEGKLIKFAGNDEGMACATQGKPLGTTELGGCGDSPRIGKLIKV